MSKYMLVGLASNEPLTYKGRVIVHNSKEELEFVLRNVKIVHVTNSWLQKNRWMWLRDHPTAATWRWPLQKEDFIH
jgi:hypothetical protein